MTNIPSSPSTENSSTSTEFIDGKIIVTETKVSEYNPVEILANLESKLADQIEAREANIQANDLIIDELQTQIAEIKDKANL